MSFQKLDPEIWHQILSLLSPSLPKPLSGWTKSEAIGEKPEIIAKRPDDGAPGTTSRRNIRSPELAVLMRTSIAFNHIASRILYNRVICDDIPALLSLRRRDAAHPHIDSKYTLLRRIRKLHLEHRKKSGVASYLSIMKDGNLLSHLDPHADNPLETACQLAYSEMGGLVVSLGDLQNVFGSKASSALTHMTVGAIFGGQDALWGIFAPCQSSPKDWSFREQMVGACRLQIEDLLHSLPLEHICFRSNEGPLSPPPTFVWYDHFGQKRKPPLFCAHFDKATKLISVPFGLPTRWLYEDSGNYNDYEGIFHGVSYAVRAAQNRRSNSSPELAEIADVCPDTTFDLSIYASGDRLPVRHGQDLAPVPGVEGARIGAEEERRVTAEFGKRWVVQPGEERGLITGASYDKITLSSSLDSPDCPSCGWVFEREVEAEGKL